MARRTKETANQQFAVAWHNNPVPGYELTSECQFASNIKRRWSIDFVLVPQNLTLRRVAIEIEGWGRHQTFKGYAKDCAKYNAVMAYDMRLFRFMAAFVLKNAEGVIEELHTLMDGDVPFPRSLME